MARRKKRPTTPQEGYSESVPFPATWNTVHGKQFDMVLPDGKVIEVPEAMKLPPEMRGKR